MVATLPRLASLERWLIPFLDLGSAIVNALPVWFGYALADVGGLTSYWVLPRKRQAARTNFSVALDRPPASPPVGRIVRKSFRTYSRMVVDVLRLRTMPIERLKSWIELHGLEHLDAALARGKGVILVTPHVGNWEPASNVVAMFSYDVLAVVGSGLVSRAVSQSRQRAGMTVVEHTRAARPAMRALRQNSVVILVADLVKDYRAAPVRLFGRDAHIAAGPAHLAVRTGAALVPVVSIRQADNTSIIRCEPPLYVDQHADTVAESNRLSQAIAAYFERTIVAHPEQWYPYRPLLEGRA